MTDRTIIVIGSPSRKQVFKHQFIDAAASRGSDANTLWLVEKTGHEAAGVSPSYVAQRAPAGACGWITPQETLVGWINSMTDGRIKTLIVFSHGLRGLVALRYGWEDRGLASYGLTVAEIDAIDPKRFRPVPTIEFDSCNSGVPELFGGQSIAQALANRLNTPVGGWTGRTSYANINRGGGQVTDSGQTRNPISAETWRELGSRLAAGGKPRFQLFQPPTPVNPRAGG